MTKERRGKVVAFNSRTREITKPSESWGDKGGKPRAQIIIIGQGPFLYWGGHPVPAVLAKRHVLDREYTWRRGGSPVGQRSGFRRCHLGMPLPSSEQCTPKTTSSSCITGCCESCSTHAASNKKDEDGLLAER